MSALINRVLCSTALACLSVSAFAVDYGRTEGSFGVSPTGAATYTIPIWTPPGPNGLTPSLSLSYSSQGGNGLAGVGWNLNAAFAIERCARTKHQDGSDGGIDLTLNDRFCIGGNRLRLDSGTYGAAGSVYLTEIADYSRITAYGTAGNGPSYFVVEAKSGLKYEYGATTSSRVFPGISPTISTTAHRWMLDKVYDRNGNNYVISYNKLNGFAVPDVISWTPTYFGSTSYKYEAKFNYGPSPRVSWDSYLGRVAGFDVENRNRLENIQIKSSSVVKRKYVLGYSTASVTTRSLLTSAKECADDAETNCFLPISFSYQSGLGGLTAGAGTPPVGSSTNLKIGRYDFNRDGKDDILYWSGSSWYAAFGASSGFAGPYNTGITGGALVDRFLPNGRDGIATIVSGNLWIYRWDDATAAFVGYNTTIASTMPSIAVDYDGNGLADLVYYTSNNPTLTFRRNNGAGLANPSFESTTTTNTLSGQTWGAVFSYFGNGLQRADFNGDGMQDGYAVVLQPIYNGMGQQIGNQQYAAGLRGTGTGMTLESPGTWVVGGNPVWPSLKFNDDQCTDRQVGTNILVAACNGIAATTVAIPAAPLLLLDWDGDGKTDVLVNNGGTFGVYKSTGAGFSSIVSTSISSTGTYFALDQDGDGLEDLIKVNGTSALSYWTHTSTGSIPSYATNIPELLSSVTDGFGVNHSPSYVSTAWSSYDKGVDNALQQTGPRIVVANVANSNGIGGTFYKTYFYSGARENGDRGGEFAGFQRVDETDSRNGFTKRTYFDQIFPLAGRVKQVELMQSGGFNAISREVITNASTQLGTPPATNNERYFVYASGSTATQYEYGGTWNTALLRTVATANTYETTGGTLYDQTVTTTEPASGANGVMAGGEWKARTYLPLANLTNDSTNWCLSRPGVIQQINSHNLTYPTPITRTTNVTWDAANCRPTQSVDEAGSGTLQVTTDIGYDGFGNVNSTIVTGVGMDPRSTTTIYSDGTYTSGQFPLSVTQSVSGTVNQTSAVAWNYDLGLPASTNDPNGLLTSWQYDAFGRRTREDDADGTYVTWSFASCGGCDPRGKIWVDQYKFGPGGGLVTRAMSYFDQFDRSFYEASLRPDNNYNITTRAFDALGNVQDEYFPFSSAGSSVGSVTTAYDLVNRPAAISRPISDSNPALQTTTIFYEGLTTRIRDAQNKFTYRVVNAAGQLARSQDHDGYYQGFDYDAFGGVKRVRDSASPANDLQVSNYNIRGMLTSRTDMDMGTWTFTPNALGEVISQTDANGQTMTFAFDRLGRLTSRIDPAGAGTSSWTWGVLADNAGGGKYIGRLKTVSGPGYSETYSYDSIGRPSSTSISADTTYQIDYSYNAAGALDTLTYPTSTSSYRLKLQYDYQNGFLSAIKDYNAPTTVFWAANSFNPRNQITQETLGNGLVTSRSIDAVTGWLKTIQTGVGVGTGVQNLAYEWDLAGNLAKRKDVNQSNLTETFVYDNLYRLDYSQLNGVTNLDLSYDLLGNITYKSDVGTYTYDATKKHQVRSTSNGWIFGYDNNGNMNSGLGTGSTWTSFNYPASITSGSNTAAFSYTPGRQYWQQVANYTTGGAATTIYVGGLLEKVTTSAGTDFRHMIRAGGSSIIVSRQSSGTNSVNYVTSDHLGSSSAITNGSGGILVNSSFGAFGARRGSNWTGSPSAGDWTAIASTTRRGFTEHSMLDNLNLTHMNGRVYDQLLGRFVSADSHIGEPGNTQNYNRYSYVYNNPLSAIDPSGFDSDTPPTIPRGPNLPTYPLCYGTGATGGCEPGIVREQDEPMQEIVVCANCKSDGDRSWSGIRSRTLNWSPLGRPQTAELGDEIYRQGRFVCYKVGCLSDDGNDFLPEPGMESASWLDPLVLIPVAGLDKAGCTGECQMGAILFVAVATRSPSAARGGLQAAGQLGRAGEAAAGIVKNTERIASATGTAAYRVPDILNHSARVIGDVKNVGSLSYTSQLRDFAAYASRNGYTYELWVRPTTQLSGPLQQAVANGEIVLRFLP
jgi:RHS repeat-associated protein